MNRSGWLLGLACAAGISTACSSPGLSVEFQVEEPYRSAMASVGLEIFLPPPGAPFTCEDLAFARVDPGAVALSRVGAFGSDALELRFEDLDRRARKLLWAEGRDKEHGRLVTGCVEVGEVREDERVTVAAEPVPQVEVVGQPVLSATVGRGTPDPIALQVRDGLGRPLGGVAAEYVVDGAGGVASSGREYSDEAGELRWMPGYPARPGPFLLDIRVRWAEGSPTILHGVIAPRPEVLALPGGALDYRAGRIGANGEEGVAVLLADGTLGARVLLVHAASRGPKPVVDTLRVTGPRAMGVIEAGARDRVVLVASGAWIEVGADGRLGSTRDLRLPAGARTPERVLASGACAPGPDGASRGAMVQFAEGQVGIYDHSGELESSFPLSNDPLQPIDLLAAGCVSNPDGGLERTLVFGRGSGIGVFPALLSEDGAGFLVASWFALSWPIAFSPAGADGRRLMFGTQLDVNDIVVSRASIRRSAEEAEVIVEGLDPIPDVPVAMASGDLDGDGLVDVVALFPRRVKSGDRLALWAALGRERGGRRISGDIDILETLGAPSPPQLLVADLDSDGFQDIVVGELAPAGSSSRLAIYSMRPGPPR